MKASEHLALCESKRGGATAEERALCAELEAAEKALIEADKPCLAWIARAEAAEKDVRILTEASRANEDMIERARGSVPAERLEALAGECELMEGQGLTFMPGVMGRRLRALLAEAREEGKPPHPQIVRYETTLDGVHVTVRRDALEWLENQITLSPPPSAGTEGQGLREPERFICHMICCGLDDGYIAFATWDDADKFRESYTSGVAVAEHGYSAGPG